MDTKYSRFLVRLRGEGLKLAAEMGVGEHDFESVWDGSIRRTMRAPEEDEICKALVGTDLSALREAVKARLEDVLLAADEKWEGEVAPEDTLAHHLVEKRVTDEWLEELLSTL